MPFWRPGLALSADRGRQGGRTGYNRPMALAILYLILALVAFIGATVIAVAVMLRVQAKRGTRNKTAVDEATVAMLRRRRQRLDRRLGIDPATDPLAQSASDGEPAETGAAAGADPGGATGAAEEPEGAARP